MHRLALRLARRRPHLAPTPNTGPGAARTALSGRTHATSAPKKAEEASAQSGGSRSKDADGQKDAVEAPAKGRTGGGDPLESSENPPPRPKIHNSAVPGTGTDKLTKEQQAEVDKHNADFEKKHDRASAAADDKVDKNFWSRG